MSTLVIADDGTACGLYAEDIDLSSLGTLHIERATTIEFDNDAQYWRVRDQEGFPMFNSPSRKECLDWERQYFESRAEGRT